MSEFRLPKKAVERHLLLISNLCIFGGILFVLWALAIFFITGKSLEVWPIRIAISFILVLIGVVIRKTKKLDLQIAEWVVTAIGMTSVLYACYVIMLGGVDPIWITGTSLIIVGTLGYLSGTKQAISFPCLLFWSAGFASIFKNQIKWWPQVQSFLIFLQLSSWDIFLPSREIGIC